MVFALKDPPGFKLQQPELAATPTPAAPEAAKPKLDTARSAIGAASIATGMASSFAPPGSEKAQKAAGITSSIAGAASAIPFPPLQIAGQALQAIAPLIGLFGARKRKRQEKRRQQREARDARVREMAMAATAGTGELGGGRPQQEVTPPQPEPYQEPIVASFNPETIPVPSQKQLLNPNIVRMMHHGRDKY